LIHNITTRIGRKVGKVFLKREHRQISSYCVSKSIDNIGISSSAAGLVAAVLDKV
jgi:hypothetical protein